jgi:hypothetical protein
VFRDPEVAELTGHFHRLLEGTALPEGLEIVADGLDVGGDQPPTHHTIFPIHPMQPQAFIALFFDLGWIYEGKMP